MTPRIPSRTFSFLILSLAVGATWADNGHEKDKQSSDPATVDTSGIKFKSADKSGDPQREKPAPSWEVEVKRSFVGPQKDILAILELKKKEPEQSLRGSFWGDPKDGMFYQLYERGNRKVSDDVYSISFLDPSLPEGTGSYTVDKAKKTMSLSCGDKKTAYADAPDETKQSLRQGHLKVEALPTFREVVFVYRDPKSETYFVLLADREEAYLEDRKRGAANPTLHVGPRERLKDGVAGKVWVEGGRSYDEVIWHPKGKEGEIESWSQIQMIPRLGGLPARWMPRLIDEPIELEKPFGADPPPGKLKDLGLELKLPDLQTPCKGS